MSRDAMGGHARGAAWAGRPPGVPAVVPHPALPLAFLAASAVGMVACGVAVSLVAPTVVAHPTADTVVAAANFGTLALLSMGVLGALHQFGPVVSQRPLRSAPIAWATFVAWAVAAWCVPAGLASHHEGVVEAGGAAAGVAVVLAAVNFPRPLAARGKGVPVDGLRIGLLGLIATACTGATFIADRSGDWFVVSGHVVLAHAVLGLFLWLGVVYVAVAEKLWPMFLLAHLPGRHRSGAVAVWGIALGSITLSLGLWTATPAAAWPGALVLAGGLASHLVSMTLHVRHRRRGADLHLAFVLSGAGWLVVGALVGLIAAVVPVDTIERQRLVGAAVAALAGWLVTVLVGHAHKVVPFIVWSALRARGVQHNSDGRPLLFGDLYVQWAATATFALCALGIAGIGIGLLAASSGLVVLGGAALAATGAVAGTNLAATPLWLLARSRDHRLGSTVRAPEPAG